MFLLDVNVLIALADQDHPHHRTAFTFFHEQAVNGWATCPLVENGFIRIFGNINYPKGPGNPEEARMVLRSFLAAPGHRFWADDLSIADGVAFPQLIHSKQITDIYLLALAIKNGGKLATLDRGLPVGTIKGGENAYIILRLQEKS